MNHHPTSAWLHTTLRGSRIGFAGMAFMSLPLVLLGWKVVADALLSGHLPTLEMAMVAPLMAAFCTAMTMALLASTWAQMRRQSAARLLPGAQAVMARALLGCSAALWLWAGLPALAVTAAHGLDPASSLPLVVALVYGLGVPVAAGAAGAGFAVLPMRASVRTAVAVLGWLPVLAPGVLHRGVELPAALRNAVLLTIGLAGLWGAWWAFGRVADSLTRQAIDREDPALTPLWRFKPTLRGFDGRTPMGSRWLASPDVVGLRATDLLMTAVMSVLLIVALPRWAGTSPSLATTFSMIIAGTSCPWLVGAWVSPRWSLLPGGLSRRHTAWRVLRQCLAGGAPRTAAMTLVYAGVTWTATAITWLQWLALLLSCVAIVVLSACLAVATLPWCRSAPAQAAGPAAALILGSLGFMGVQGLGAAPAAAEQWPELLPTAGMTLVYVAFGLLAVAASSRAWARYDWARMPAQPAAQRQLLR